MELPGIVLISFAPALCLSLLLRAAWLHLPRGTAHLITKEGYHILLICTFSALLDSPKPNQTQSGGQEIEHKPSQGSQGHTSPAVSTAQHSTEAAVTFTLDSL